MPLGGGQTKRGPRGWVGCALRATGLGGRNQGEGVGWATGALSLIACGRLHVVTSICPGCDPGLVLTAYVFWLLRLLWP